MNELTWKSLGVFFSVYQETGDMLSAEVDAKILETKLKKNAQEVFDAVASLKHEDYVTGLTHNTWRITREGIKAWESRQADATHNASEAAPQRTLFVEADSLSQLQAEVDRREAEGWAFLSLSVALGPSPDTHEGSAAQVLHDIGATSPRLYVAALQK